MSQFKLIDLTGKKFNRLFVVSLHSIGKRTKWNCVCDCGKHCIKEGYTMKMGLSKSCGCYKSELNTARLQTHGLTKHSLYSVWTKMKDRCGNINIGSYKNYGARGIHVCSEWVHDFKNFYEWAIGNGWATGLQLDRIDNNEGYLASNCRFVSVKINANNKRNNVHVSYNGTPHSMYDLERISGLPSSRILRRIRDYRWDVERAISTPVRSLKSKNKTAAYSS